MRAEPEVRPWVMDLLLGVAVTAVLALLMALDPRGSRPADAVAFGFAAFFGALMLVRRRFPRGVLALTFVLLCGYYILDYPPIGMAVPLAAALFSAAEAGRLGFAVVVAALGQALSSYFRLMEGEPAEVLLGYELVSNAAIMAAALALGDGVRSRRARRVQQEQLNALLVADTERRAEARAHAERESLARDLHDSIGHRLSVISLHAGVAQEEIGNDDARAATAVNHIRAASRELLAEVRAVVKALRSPEQPAAPLQGQESHAVRDQPVISLAGVQTLVAQAREAGLDATLRQSGGPGESADWPLTVPGTVQAAAFRVVQEGLTNAMRHGGGAAVAVDLTMGANAAGERRLSVQVISGPPSELGGPDRRGPDRIAAESRTSATRSPGPHPSEPQTTGTGLIGMRERVRLVGGELDAGPAPGGGFRVSASLPLPPGASENRTQGNAP